MCVNVTLCHNVFERAQETDRVHKCEGQRQVTLLQTTVVHVLIWHVGSDDNCYVTACNSAKFGALHWCEHSCVFKRGKDQLKCCKNQWKHCYIREMKGTGLLETISVIYVHIALLSCSLGQCVHMVVQWNAFKHVLTSPDAPSPD